MAKRLTDCNIWRKPWYRKLTPAGKCFVRYLFDSCDVAGIWEVDFELAEFLIGEPVSGVQLPDDFYLEFDDGKKWVIRNFSSFQYGENLNEKSPVHKKVIDILKKYKIGNNTLYDTLFNTLSNRGKEEDKEEEEEKEEEKEKEKGKKKAAVSKIEYPFGELDFLNLWNQFKEYKKEQFGFTYKPAGEQAALISLGKLSGGDKEKAKAIIMQSIANGWKGLFELKQSSNDKNKQGFTDDQSSYFASLKGI